MAFMGYWGTGVEPGTQYTEKVSCTVWKMMMMNNDVTVISFKLCKYSSKFANKLSVVFVYVMRWSVLITQY